MNGMELSRRYWLEVGLPAFERECPEVLERAAVGLVGEGSECFGFDDELSRDHDWGPGFCLWLTRQDMERWGKIAQEIYRNLPEEYLGFRRLRPSSMSSGRVGVLEISSFYMRFLGLDRPPQTLTEWLYSPESGLSAATNGEVFRDSAGEFSSVRESLLAYYPEDVRRKKLAAQCALAAQSGQYNYHRCRVRNQPVASFLALSQFIEHAQAIIFLLNRRYRPYYKWTQRALCALPVLGQETAPLLRALTISDSDKEEIIEQISGCIIAELKRQGLSECHSDFLLPHGEEIQSRIGDASLRSLHLMLG